MKRTRILLVSILMVAIVAFSAYAYWQQRYPWGKFVTVRGMEQTSYQFSESSNGAGEVWHFVTDRPSQEVAASLIAEARRVGAPESDLVLTEENESGDILHVTFKSGATYWSINVQNGQSPGFWRVLERTYPAGATVTIARSNTGLKGGI